MVKLWKVKDGATQHLVDKGYFHESGSIDGLIGIQTSDYTDVGFEYPHLGLDLINTDFSEVGISTDWLIPIV